jgi:hypothetical protein
MTLELFLICPISSVYSYEKWLYYKCNADSHRAGGNFVIEAKNIICDFEWPRLIGPPNCPSNLYESTCTNMYRGAFDDLAGLL